MCRSRRNAEAICQRAGHQRCHCHVNTKCGTARGEGQWCKWLAAGGWRGTPPNARGPARTCDHRGQTEGESQGNNKRTGGGGEGPLAPQCQRCPSRRKEDINTAAATSPQR